MVTEPATPISGSPPRILVGTLYTIEQELDACLVGIRKQRDVAVEHFVVDNLPNKAAHDQLYQTFMDRADDFDLFIKVDADMVIQRGGLFAELAAHMASRPELLMLSVAVHDYFSDRLIMGMNTFRSSLRWTITDEQVFVDDNPAPASARDSDMVRFAPAAMHCPDPSPFQAFHFGMHKGVKVAVGRARGGERIQQLRGHWDNIEMTWAHFRRIRDRRLGWASLGAELAMAGEFTSEHVSYDNPAAAERFARDYEAMDADSLTAKVRGLRRGNRRGLPSRFVIDSYVFGRLGAALRFPMPMAVRRRLGEMIDGR